MRDAETSNLAGLTITTVSEATPMKRLYTILILTGISGALVAVLWLVLLGVRDEDIVGCAFSFTARCKEMISRLSGPDASIIYSPLLAWISLTLCIAGVVIEAREK